SICIGQECLSNRQAKEYDLAAGTYTLTAPGSTEMDSGSSGLGTLTVASDGTVTLDGTAQKHFHPPEPSCPAGTPPPCRATTLRAQVAQVTLNRSGYAGQLGIYWVSGSGTTVTLLTSRRYALYDGSSHAMASDMHVYSEVMDLE